MKKLLRNAVAMIAFTATTLAFGPSASAKDVTDLLSILTAKAVRVGAVSAPPWYNKDLITNKWTGLVPDVIDVIFSGTGVKIDYVDTQWGTAVAGLQSDRFDLLGAYNETPERAKAIDFTAPIGSLKMAVLTLDAPQKFATWAGMNQPSVRLSAIDGAGATRLLQPIIPNASWHVNSTSDAMYLDLQSGRADALVTSDVQISQYLEQRHQGYLVVPTPVYSQPTNIGLRKSADPALRTWLNHRLTALQADGTLDKIWAKYVSASATK